MEYNFIVIDIDDDNYPYLSMDNDLGWIKTSNLSEVYIFTRTHNIAKHAITISQSLVIDALFIFEAKYKIQRSLGGEKMIFEVIVDFTSGEPLSAYL